MEGQPAHVSLNVFRVVVQEGFLEMIAGGGLRRLKRSVVAPELRNQIKRQYCREHKLVLHLCILAPTRDSVGLRITEFGADGVEMI